MIFPVSDCHKKENTSFLHKKHSEISYGKKKPLFEKYISFRNNSYILLKREYILNC